MLNLNLVQIFLKRFLKYSEQLIFSAAKQIQIHCTEVRFASFLSGGLPLGLVEFIDAKGNDVAQAIWL